MNNWFGKGGLQLFRMALIHPLGGTANYLSAVKAGILLLSCCSLSYLLLNQ